MPRDSREGPRDGRGGGSGRRGRQQAPSIEERLSRFLAFVLRHHPEEVGLTLDERGTADLDELVAVVQTRPGFASITREYIERLVATMGKQRFEILEGRIRARYGHSLSQPILHEPAEPPAELFHGTTPEVAEQVLAEGLAAGQRQYVHLSADTAAAREVGERHCSEPAILRIDTASAAQVGTRFYPAGPSVWLSDPIPPECITRAE